VRLISESNSSKKRPTKLKRGE